MTKKELDYLAKHIEKVMDKKFNGKMDRMDKKFCALAEKVEPIFEAYNTAHNFGKFTIWISKISLAIGVLIASIVAIVSTLK